MTSCRDDRLSTSCPCSQMADSLDMLGPVSGGGMDLARSFDLGPALNQELPPYDSIDCLSPASPAANGRFSPPLVSLPLNNAADTRPFMVSCHAGH